jgi:hypothetical protein
MEGHRAPREANKADLAKEGFQDEGELEIARLQGVGTSEPSLIDVMVGTSRMRNNGKKDSRASNHCKLLRFGKSVDDGVDTSASTT